MNDLFYYRHLINEKSLVQVEKRWKIILSLSKRLDKDHIDQAKPSKAMIEETV